MRPSQAEPRLRKAEIADVKTIHRLINEAAGRDELLPRSLSDIYEKLRDFHVCEAQTGVVGCCALHIVWEDIAELRSLSVAPEWQAGGIGAALVKRCLEECRELGVARIFALTYIPVYFKRFGFDEVSKDTLPHKVWADCLKCPKFPDCGEIAVARSLDGG